MEKYIIILLALMPFCSDAQIAAGTVFLGGDLSATAEKDGSEHYSTLWANPQVGFVLNPRNAVGFGIGYQGMKTTGTGFLTAQHTTSLNVFHRYYIPISDGFYFTVHSQVGLGFAKVSTGTDDINSTTFIFQHSPGPLKQVSLRFLMNTSQKKAEQIATPISLASAAARSASE